MPVTSELEKLRQVLLDLKLLSHIRLIFFVVWGESFSFISEQLLYQNRTIHFTDFWLIHSATIKNDFGLFVVGKQANRLLWLRII